MIYYNWFYFQRGFSEPLEPRPLPVFFLRNFECEIGEITLALDDLDDPFVPPLPLVDTLELIIRMAS